jgi:putative transposase
MPYIGTRKLAAKLRDADGLAVGRKLVRRYMAEMGIKAVYPKPDPSKPARGHEHIPYLLKKKPIFLPNQVWAVDITYIPLRRSHM